MFLLTESSSHRVDRKIFASTGRTIGRQLGIVGEAQFEEAATVCKTERNLIVRVLSVRLDFAIKIFELASQRL